MGPMIHGKLLGKYYSKKRGTLKREAGHIGSKQEIIYMILENKHGTELQQC
jgi:hypothetical protein